MGISLNNIIVKNFSRSTKIALDCGIDKAEYFFGDDVYSYGILGAEKIL